MRDEFDKINEKLDHVVTEIIQINQTLIEQNGDLKLHIARTEAAEGRLDIIEKVLKPINESATKIQGILQGIGVVAMFVGLIAGFMKILEFFNIR